jgi:hypothetical protein
MHLGGGHIEIVAGPRELFKLLLHTCILYRAVDPRESEAGMFVSGPKDITQPDLAAVRM